MTIDELKRDLTYLIKKYIDDECLKESLLDEALSKDNDNIGVKGILHEINCSKIPVEDSDSKIIKNIAFHYI